MFCTAPVRGTVSSDLELGFLQLGTGMCDFLELGVWDLEFVFFGVVLLSVLRKLLPPQIGSSLGFMKQSRLQVLPRLLPLLVVLAACEPLPAQKVPVVDRELGNGLRLLMVVRRDERTG